MTDWTKFQNNLLNKYKYGQPYLCDCCSISIPYHDVVFCVCQDFICQDCKNGEIHKDHQTMGEYIQKILKKS